MKTETPLAITSSFASGGQKCKTQHLCFDKKLVINSADELRFPARTQSCRTLNKPYVYLHDNQVNIIQYGIVFAWMFIKKYHENTS